MGIPIKMIARQCPSCKDLVFSRARHDCRFCSCGEIFVDGGFDYRRVGYKKKEPKEVEITINQTPSQLYDDWNHLEDKYGVIKGEESEVKRATKRSRKNKKEISRSR